MRKCEPVPFSGCWLWTGATISNKRGFQYGVIGEGGSSERGAKQLLAHRASWLIFRGPIPDGVQVLHRCDVPCCVNPDHLFLGTRFDNMQDCYQKGRMPQAITTERAKGERNPKAKLSPDDVFQIRAMRASGKRYLEIASKFGVGDEAIKRICTGRSWKHVTADAGNRRDLTSAPSRAA